MTNRAAVLTSNVLSNPETILITGGAGFIGSALVRFLLKETPHRIINIDKLTYSGSLLNLPNVHAGERYQFFKVDISDRNKIEEVFYQYKPQVVMHLAAESHVDRSIKMPEVFIKSNIQGTFDLLEYSRKHWLALPKELKQNFRFLHVSTDEVFGTLGAEGFFTENTPYAPNSPYSASKAASDHLVRAWHHTYGLPTLITNCSNNYGPFQFPEKLIPSVITKALNMEPIPVYGKGLNVRDWLYVDDHVRALLQVVSRGRVGETYNIGCRNERQNIDVVRSICKILDEQLKIVNKAIDQPTLFSHAALIDFVADRAGHDLRYAIDPKKIEQELDWRPLTNFEDGLRETVLWYLENKSWTKAVLENGRYKQL